MSVFFLALATALPATPSTGISAPSPTRTAFVPPFTINPTDHIFRDVDTPTTLLGPLPEPLPPHVTAMPAGHDAALASQGFTQTTYYTCRTARDGGAEQCGWHVPLMEVAEGAGVKGRVDGRVVGAVVVGLMGVFVMGLL